MNATGSTRVVMLGTGTPRPEPDRSGPATAIVVNDVPYLVDFGAGVIRRAVAAYQNGVTAFGPDAANIATAFLTHLHSDHTMGYPDLMFTPWLRGRKALDVYGPKGLEVMTSNIFKAWEVDIRVRTTVGPHRRDACIVKAHEIEPGIVYSDRNVTVTAFPVHEAYSMETYRQDPPTFQEFRRGHHTSSVELAQIANTVKPGLLVTYHHSTRDAGPLGSDKAGVLIDEIRQGYKGNVVAARDLDVF